jgi:hypothetical protein
MYFLQVVHTQMSIMEYVHTQMSRMEYFLLLCDLELEIVINNSSTIVPQKWRSGSFPHFDIISMPSS